MRIQLPHDEMTDLLNSNPAPRSQNSGHLADLLLAFLFIALLVTVLWIIFSYGVDRATERPSRCAGLSNVWDCVALVEGA